MFGTTTFRGTCAALGICALLGYFRQEQLVGELKHQNEATYSALTQADRFMLEHEQIHEKGWDCQNSVKEETITTTTTSGTTTAIDINAENPLFVLSLRNHLDLAIPRYFECAGYDSSSMARYFTKPPKAGKREWEMGRFMQESMKKKRAILKNFPTYQVYTDLHFWSPPDYRAKAKAMCFDMVIFPGALEQLYKERPTATIINVVRDPVEWLDSLPKQFPRFWSDWCNPSHNNTFPSAQEISNLDDNPRPMLGFYLQYQQRLRQFAKDHPTMNYIEINLQDSPQSTAARLEQSLGIQSQCWIESVQGNVRMLPDAAIPHVLQEQPRPNTVGYPILVTAMPKAGTTTLHSYFECGLGPWASAHQWTSLTEEPSHSVAIGECLINNTNHDHYPFFDGCGHHLVWGDTGVLRQQQHTCYFPFLHRQGLERFYKSYPYGTILNTVRNTTSWVDSAFRWRELPNRWVNAKCEGFPTQRWAPRAEWGAWYEGVQKTVRKFAQEHPTLTYIELPLSDQTGDMLHDIFGYPRGCWGHANVNTKRPPDSSNSTTAKLWKVIEENQQKLQ